MREELAEANNIVTEEIEIKKKPNPQ